MSILGFLAVLAATTTAPATLPFPVVPYKAPSVVVVEGQFSQAGQMEHSELRRMVDHCSTIASVETGDQVRDNKFAYCMRLEAGDTRQVVILFRKGGTLCEFRCAAYIKEGE
jgi:hypothetical protein